MERILETQGKILFLMEEIPREMDYRCYCLAAWVYNAFALVPLAAVNIQTRTTKKAILQGVATI